jgi:hypothetical protein
VEELKTYVSCADCSRTYGTHDFHDCKGVFDEIRWQLEGRLPNSAWIRVKKKYGLRKDDPELISQMRDYLDDMSLIKYKILETSYRRKLKEITFELSRLTTEGWELEDLLWRS